MLLRFFQAQAQASYVAGFPVPLQLPPGPTVDVTVLGLVGGAPGGETPRVADSSAAGAGRFFHNKRTSTRLFASGCKTLAKQASCVIARTPIHET